jgi:hypothetical protein
VPPLEFFAVGCEGAYIPATDTLSQVSALPPYPIIYLSVLSLANSIPLSPHCNMNSKPPRDPDRSKDRPATPVIASRSVTVTVPVSAPINRKVCNIIYSSRKKCPCISLYLPSSIVGFSFWSSSRSVELQCPRYRSLRPTRQRPQEHSSQRRRCSSSRPFVNRVQR